MEFKDFDGEAVAYAAPYFYVIGSHGCGRKHGAFHPSSFILARIRVDSQGRPVDAQGRQVSEAASGDAVETTYRISDLLQHPSAVSPFFGKRLEEVYNGLNIEGLAVVGDKLFVGLRAPSVEGKAYIVGASLIDLFAPGNAPAAGKPEVIAIQLGPKTSRMGIRDLAPYKDRLLVLAGPAQHQSDVSYSLFIVEPRRGVRPTPIAAIPDVIEDSKRLSAESLTILNAQDDELRILIMFDGPKNGEPREYRVSLNE
jgi:hypothetical protein